MSVCGQGILSILPRKGTTIRLFEVYWSARLAPQAAVEIKLDINPLNMFTNGEAANTALTSREIGHRALVHFAILTATRHW